MKNVYFDESIVPVKGSDWLFYHSNSKSRVFSQSGSLTPLTLMPPGTCDEGWVSFQTSCYLLSTSGASWSSAEQQCLSHGAHLLVLNSVEELVRQAENKWC